MLILPIVNKNRVMNVQIKLKNASKIKRRVHYRDANESEIICNGSKLSESMYKDSKDYGAPTNFVRNNLLMYPRNYLITTALERDTSVYDVYEVVPPPKKVNNELDNLYGRVLTDMRKEMPNSNKGRYVSFEKIGIDKHLTDEKIIKLQKVVSREKDVSRWPYLFEQEGITDLPETLNFMKNFDCTVVSSTSIPESSIQDSIKALEIINTRDYKNLNNYYDMAKSNRDIYAKLSYINKLIYNQPLGLIQSKSQTQKQLIKVQDDYNA